ncbi:uncharacterized protein GJ701_016302 isoform 2-T2 [Geothlypis trichas]
MRPVRTWIVWTEYREEWQQGREKESHEEMSEAEWRCIEAEFERLRRCRRSGSALCCGSWLSWTAPSQLPTPKNPCGWPRGLHSSTDSLGSWRPGACPSLSEMRFHLPSGLPKQLDKSLSSCHQSDALWEALEKFRAPRHPSSAVLGFGFAVPPCPAPHPAEAVAGRQSAAGRDQTMTRSFPCAPAPPAGSRGKPEAVNGGFLRLTNARCGFFLIISPYFFFFPREKAKADQFWGRADFKIVWEHRTAFIVLPTLFITTIPD